MAQASIVSPSPSQWALGRPEEGPHGGVPWGGRRRGPMVGCMGLGVGLNHERIAVTPGTQYDIGTGKGLENADASPRYERPASLGARLRHDDIRWRQPV